jgi:hypothetical protein
MQILMLLNHRCTIVFQMEHLARSKHDRIKQANCTNLSGLLLPPKESLSLLPWNPHLSSTGLWYGSIPPRERGLSMMVTATCGSSAKLDLGNVVTLPAPEPGLCPNRILSSNSLVSSSSCFSILDIFSVRFFASSGAAWSEPPLIFSMSFRSTFRRLISSFKNFSSSDSGLKFQQKY